jgi:hypothetical protein
LVLPAETEERVKRKALSACQENLRKVLDVTRKIPQMTEHFAKGDKDAARQLFIEIKRAKKKSLMPADGIKGAGRDWCYTHQP